VTVPAQLDRAFRDRAAAEGVLDVAFQLTESPVGELLLAATGRGVCRISFDPEPEASTSTSTTSAGSSTCPST
jgi:hypothetical protein